MKLSQLKQLVQNIERNTILENPDPEVTFWCRRTDVSNFGSKEDAELVEFSPYGSEVLNAEEHRIVGTSENMLAKVGDFSIPLMAVPILK